MSEKRLIKVIPGKECEIYAVSHHRRVEIGKAEPCIEVYEKSIEGAAIGSKSIRSKKTYFSITICPCPEIESVMNDELLRSITSFDLNMLLLNDKDVYVPVTLFDVGSVELSDEKWVFEITDFEAVKMLREL